MRNRWPVRAGLDVPGRCILWQFDIPTRIVDCVLVYVRFVVEPMRFFNSPNQAIMPVDQNGSVTAMESTAQTITCPLLKHLIFDTPHSNCMSQLCVRTDIVICSDRQK